VRPEDIILNIGKGIPIPKPNMPGKWKNVIHDQTVTWLANWTENINGNHKYVFLAAGSSLKGQSDMLKFEKARELKVSSFLLLTSDSAHPNHRIMLTASAKITMRT
jgi:DNA topoisomerase I